MGYTIRLYHVRVGLRIGLCPPLLVLGPRHVDRLDLHAAGHRVGTASARESGRESERERREGRRARERGSGGGRDE